MAKSRLTQQFTYGAWLKFSKNYKMKYKEKYGVELKEPVAQEITFNKLTKQVAKYKDVTNEDGTVERKLVYDKEVKMPEIEDIIDLIKLGNNDCSDDTAITILQNYLEDENTSFMGFTGAMIDLMCDFYNDLNIITGAYKKCRDLREKYINNAKDLDKEEITQE